MKIQLIFFKYSKEFVIDFEVKDKRGRTPIHYVFASKHKPKEQVEWFLEVAKNELEYQGSTWTNSTRIVRFL